jgi:hypothetical protein
MLELWLGERLVEPVATHLVFVDLNRVVTERWGIVQARAEVRRVLAEIHRPYSLGLNTDACTECSIRSSCAVR